MIIKKKNVLNIVGGYVVKREKTRKKLELLLNLDHSGNPSKHSNSKAAFGLRPFGKPQTSISIQSCT